MMKQASKNFNDSLDETKFVPVPAEIKEFQGILVKGKPGHPEVCIDFSNQPPQVSTGRQAAVNIIRGNPGSLTSDFENFDSEIKSFLQVLFIFLIINLELIMIICSQQDLQVDR